MIMISERPAEADDRAVPGHWEGGLILASNCRSAIGTLVQRSSILGVVPEREGRTSGLACLRTPGPGDTGRVTPSRRPHTIPQVALARVRE